MSDTADLDLGFGVNTDSKGSAVTGSSGDTNPDALAVAVFLGRLDPGRPLAAPVVSASEAPRLPEPPGNSAGHTDPEGLSGPAVPGRRDASVDSTVLLAAAPISGGALADLTVLTGGTMPVGPTASAACHAEPVRLADGAVSTAPIALS